jgi:hypothetical protein
MFKKETSRKKLSISFSNPDSVVYIFDFLKCQQELDERRVPQGVTV